jgi:hypothetical protein
MIWFIAHISRHQVVPLNQSSCVSAVELVEKSGANYDGEEAWSSTNYSILSTICLQIWSLGFSIEGGVRGNLTVEAYIIPSH